MTDGFRNRVATNVVPQAQRDPAAFGSGFAQGVQQLGRAGFDIAQQDTRVQAEVAASEDRIAEIEKRRAQSAMVAQNAGTWADTQVQLSGDLADLRTKAPVADYSKKASDLITERLKGFLDPLQADEEVYQRFAPLVANFGAQTRIGEDDWARKQQVKAEGEGIDKHDQVAGNRLFADPTPVNLVATLDADDAIVDGLDLSPEQRAQVATKLKAGHVGQFFEGRLAQGDWRGARALLDSGKFDQYVDRQQYAQKIAIVEQGELRAQQQAANEAKAVARQTIDAVSAKIDAGIAPTAAELDGAEAGGRAVGLDPADLIKFRALRVKTDVIRRYGALIGVAGGADQLRVTRDALAGQVASGKASENDQIALAQLNGLVDKADDKEVGALKDMAAKGPTGTLQALAQLSGTPEARYDRAEKIAAGLGPLALLGPRTRMAAVQGADLLKARPRDFGTDQEADTAAKTALGSAIVANLGGQFRDVVSTARAIMANKRSAVGGYDAKDFGEALLLATGATYRPGSGVIVGGVQKVRGRPVQLPDWMAAGEFDTAISRHDFGLAVYANGQAADKADVLAHYTPTLVGTDAQGRLLYEWRNASGEALRAKAGGAFVSWFGRQ